MRVLDGEQVLIRIFIGDGDKWHHQPLSSALVERFRREGCAGATVFHAIAGFGARSIVHSSHVLRMSEDLPILIEVVDTPEQTDRIIAILDEMVAEGLVTMERVRVLKYAPGDRPHSPSDASRV
jgi:PII-like signaling protein